MDAEKFALTVLMALVIAIVIRLSLAVARRLKIRLPWDATITGCPRCGAAEDFNSATTPDKIDMGLPVVRGTPRSGLMDDTVNVAAVIVGIGVTLAGCTLLLSGVGAWVVGGSGMSVAVRVLVGLLGVGAAIVALPLGIQVGMWGWRRGLLPPVVACNSCGWRDPKHAF
jgi:hypothetical protein